MTNEAALLEALAEPTRRIIVERLAEQPAAVTQLAAQLPISRSAVSQHLQVLKSVGLVTDRAEGTRRIYSVDPDALALCARTSTRSGPGRFPRFALPLNAPGGPVTTIDDRTSVSTFVDVAAPIEHAFAVFTDLGRWWDDDKHILAAPLAEMVSNPASVDDIIDRGVDGSECRWARVLAYDPPRRLCFSWDINTSWQLETDPTKCSEVDITFVETSPGGRGSPSRTATSTGTATAGRACGTRSDRGGA